MQMNNIQGISQELYGDFAYRYQQAQSLPKDKKGVIFIGNTRAGKSTLCCASANVPMSIVYQKGQVTYINPSDPKYSSYVKNSNQSVTQRPNFFPSNTSANRVVLVDMPGNDDNLFVRKLINFHYFKTMASNLEQVRFLMVVTLQIKRDKYFLNEKQLQMMETFRLMLPACQQNINIILNRIDEAKGKQKQIKLAFRQAISNCKNKDFKNYYATIGDSQIYVIQRPVYHLGKQGQIEYTQRYQQINKIMISIVNDEKKPFKRLTQDDYNILNIFNKQNNRLHQSNIKEFQTLCKGLKNGLLRSRAGFHKLVKLLFQKICNNQPIDSYSLQGYINTLLQSCQNNIKLKTSRNNLNNQESGQFQIEIQRTIHIQEKQPAYSFVLSHILQFCYILSKEQYIRPKDCGLKQYQKISKDLLHALISKFIIIVKYVLPYDDQIHKKLMTLYVYIIRRNEELVFLFSIINNSSIFQLQQGPYQEIQQTLIDTSLIITEFSFIDLSLQFATVSDEYMRLDIKKIIVQRNNENCNGIKCQLMNSFNYISCLIKNQIRDQKDRERMREEIQKKKKFIELIILLYVEPCAKQKLQLSEQEKEKLKIFIRDLIKWDIKTESVQFRIHIVYRIAELLYRFKDFKNSLILHLMLNLNEETIRIMELAQIQQSSLPCDFYYEIAGYFEKNAQFNYATRCLQKGKKEAIKNPSFILKFEQKLEKLSNDKAYDQQMRNKKKTKRQNLETLYQWQQIYKEIQYLKNAYNVEKVNLKALPYMLKNLR